MTRDTCLSRRAALALGLAAWARPPGALAATAREIGWEDLIPPGTPYAEIIGQGEIDEANDTWSPVYDANATKLNEALDGAHIRMPGYIVPLTLDADGVSEFLLVPYVGACIHLPPPPPNQLVLVTTATPWPGDALWDPVWVTGTMRAQPRMTDLGDTGYSMAADAIEIYEW